MKQKRRAADDVPNAENWVCVPCGGHDGRGKYARRERRPQAQSFGRGDRKRPKTSPGEEDTSSQTDTDMKDDGNGAAECHADWSTDDQGAADGRVQTTTRRPPPSYEGKEFTKDAGQLSDTGNSACLACSRHCGLRNYDSLKAFWYFLALYFSAHGCAEAGEHMLRANTQEHDRRNGVLCLGLDAGAWARMCDWKRDP